MVSTILKLLMLASVLLFVVVLYVSIVILAMSISTEDRWDEAAGLPLDVVA